MQMDERIGPQRLLSFGQKILGPYSLAAGAKFEAANFVHSNRHRGPQQGS